MSIQVLTLDGKRRIGYLVAGGIVPIGSTRLLMLQPPPPPRRPETIAFNALPTPRGGFYRACTQCGDRRLEPIHDVETDVGPRRVLMCGNCNTVMRP